MERIDVYSREGRAQLGATEVVAILRTGLLSKPIGVSVKKSRQRVLLLNPFDLCEHEAPLPSSYFERL